MQTRQRLKAMGHMDVPWDVNVVDPRDERGRRHDHRGLLNAMVLALLGGLHTLRGVEEVLEEVKPGARRRLGLPKTASDSAFYRLLTAQNPEGFRQTVWNQIDELWAQGLLSNDLVPGGVLSFDGKGAWSSTTTEVAGAKVSRCDGKGKLLWMVGSLRSVLVSSSAKPCLDMELIADKDAESTSFRVMFPRLCEFFGRRFRLVTGDAAFACRDNATLIHQAGKEYLLSVKGNQPTLLALAQARLQEYPCELRTEERANGCIVTRELARATFAEDDDALRFDGARQLWRIRQTTLCLKTGDVSCEDRYFISSLPPEEITAASALALVRLHWGIENGHNWTMDCILHEDDSQPCQQSLGSIEVFTWLRILALNIVSAWRARLPPKDKRPQPWVCVMRRLRDAIVHFAFPEPLVQPA